MINMNEDQNDPPLCVTSEHLLDKRMFAHIHLDNRLTGSFLEGNSLRKTAQYILKNIEFMLSSDSSLLSEDKKKRIQASLEKIKEEFENLAFNDENVSNLLLEIMEYQSKKKGSVSKEKDVTEEEVDKLIHSFSQTLLSQLNHKKTIVLRGGWSGVGEEHGHAMIYKLIRHEDGSYDFLVFNTGAGIENHKLADPIHQSHYPVKAYRIPKSVNKETIEEFLAELIAPNIKPRLEDIIPKKEGVGKQDKEKDWLDSRKFDETRVYEVIKKCPGEELDPSLFTKATTKGQLSGTCSMRVLMPLLHESIQGESFQQVLYYTRLQSILDYYHIEKNKKNLQDPNVQRLLENSIQEMAEMTSKYMKRYKEGHPILNKEEGAKHLAWLQKIQKKLAEERSPAKDIKSAKEFDLKSSAETIFRVKPQSYVSQVPAKEKKEETENLTPKSMPIREQHKNIKDFLKKVYLTVKENDKLNLSETILHEVEKLFSALPLDEKKLSDYVGDLNGEDAREVLSYIQGIQRIYGKNCDLLNPHPTPRQVCTAYTATILANQVAQRYFKPNSTLYKEMLAMLPPLKPSTDSFDLSLDPVYDQRIKELQAFYKNRTESTRGLVLNACYEKSDYRDSNIPVIDKLDYLFFGKHIYQMDSISEYTLRQVEQNKNKGAMNRYDNNRITFYEGCRDYYLRGRGEHVAHYVQALKGDYDLILQYNELMQEGDCFKSSYGTKFFKEKPDIEVVGITMNPWDSSKTNRTPDSVGRIRKIRCDHAQREHSVYEGGFSRFDFKNGIEASAAISNLYEFSKTGTAWISPPQDSSLPKTDESNPLASEPNKYNEGMLPKEYEREYSFIYLMRNECRVIRGRDFFERNLELLNQSKFQADCLYSFFTPDVLNSALAANPNFINDIYRLIERGFNYHHRDNEWSEGGIFIFQLSFFLLKYLEKHPHNSQFQEIITKIKFEQQKTLDVALDQYQQKSLKPSKKLKSILGIQNDLLIVNFIRTAYLQPESISKDQLKNLFLCLIKSDQKLERRQNAYFYHELLLCKEPMKKLLKQYFEGLKLEEQKSLISDLIKENLIPHLIPDENYKYEIQYPNILIRYKDDPPIYFDLSRGKIQSSKARPDYIPEQMYSKQFIKLFGTLPIAAKVKNEGDLIFTEFVFPSKTEKTEEARFSQKKFRTILNSKTQKVIIQAELESGKWFEWTDKPESLGISIPATVFTDNIPWIEIGSDVPSVYFTDNNVQYKYLVQAKEKSKDKAEALYSLQALNKDRSSLGYTFVNPEQYPDTLKSLVQYLSNIERAEYIELWQKEPGTQGPELMIKLPLFGMEFEGYRNKEGNLEFLWSENKEFRLIQTNQEFIPGFTHALFLENTRTKEKLSFVPERDVLANEDPESDDYYKMNYDIERRMMYDPAGRPYKLNFDKLYQFRMVSQIPQASTSVEHLKLAYLYLLKNNSKKAMEELQKCGSIKGTFEEVSIIMKIMREIPVYKPSDAALLYMHKKARLKLPNVTAVRLFAASLLAKQMQISFNTPNFELDPPRSNEYASDIYENVHFEKVKRFYQNEAGNLILECYNDYQRRSGSVDKDLMIPASNELFIINTIHTKGVDIGGLWQGLTNRQICINLALLKQEKRELIKKMAQQGHKIVNLAKLQEIKQKIDELQKSQKKLRATFTKKSSMAKKSATPKKPTTVKKSAQGIPIASSEAPTIERKLKTESQAITLIPLSSLSLTSPAPNDLCEELNLQDLKQKIELLTHSKEAETEIFSQDEKKDKEELKNLIENVSRLEVSLQTLKSDSKRTLDAPDLFKERESLEEEIFTSKYQVGLIENRIKSRDFLKRDISRGRSINESRELRNTIFRETLSSPKYRDTLETKLRHHFNKEEKEINELQILIEKLANQAFLDNPSQEIQALLLQGKLKTFKIEDLIGLYLQGDVNLFHEATKLDQENIKKLYHTIHEYLIKKTDNNQRKRILKSFDSAKELDTKETAEQFQSVLFQLGDELLKTRAYRPNVHPEILVFEYYEDMLLRIEQVDMLETLLQVKEEGGFSAEIIQLIMGGGKSKVLLPLLALKSANGENLSMVEVPSGLFETNFSDLQATTNRLFGKKAIPFIFDRDTPCTVSNLKNLYQILDKEVRLERNFLVTTPEAMQSLELKYLELLGQKQVNEDQILQLEKIIKFIKTKGDVIIDECDTVLDPKKELNYTLGNKTRVPPTVLFFIQKTYSLFKEVPIHAQDKTGTLQDVMLGKITLVHEQDWNLAFSKLAHELIYNINSPLHSINGKLNDSEKNEFLLYLLGKAKHEPAFIAEKLKRDPQDLLLIGLGKAQLEILKSSLKRKLNEHFGFPVSQDFRGPKHLPIPFVAVNTPNEKAEFRALETINYAWVAHKQIGILPGDIIRKFILDFKERAKVEANNSLGRIKFNETTAAKEFQAITKELGPEGLGLVLEDIDIGEDSKVEYWQKIFSENQNVNDYILLHYILSDVRQDGDILRSNPINHIGQFRSDRKMSGTVWNEKTYAFGERFNREKSLGTDGQTIHHLSRKQKLKQQQTGNSRASIVHIAGDNPRQFILHSISEHPNTHQVHSIIDVGALFKGVSNLKVAEELASILAKRPNNKIKCILYFDEDKVLCSLPFELKKTPEGEEVLKLGKPKIIGGTDPEIIDRVTQTAKEQRFIYYDQLHTIGVDIKQPSNAIGYITQDFDTMSHKLWQGAMRERQLALNQTLEIIITKAVAESRPDKKEWTEADVVQAVQNNQNIALNELILPTSLENMNNILRKHALGRIENAKDMTEKVKLREIFNELFVINNNLDNLFFQYGQLEEWQSVENILNNHQKMVLEKYKRLMHEANLYNAADYNAIETVLDDIRKEALRNCLPFYKQTRRELGNAEVVSQKEKDQMTQTQDQKQKEEDKTKEDEKRKERERELAIQTRAGQLTLEEYSRWSEELPLNFDKFINTRINSLNTMLPKAAQFAFESNLFVTKNFQATLKTQNEVLGSDYLKPVDFFMIIKDPKTQTLKALVITQEEATEFKRTLETNRKKLLEEGYEVWIKSTSDTLLAGTSNTISHPDYSLILQQIQFFNGDIIQLEERNQLEWLFANSKAKMKFLKDSILPNFKAKSKFFSIFENSFSKEHQKILQKFIEPFAKVYASIAERDPKALYESLQFLKEMNPWLRQAVINMPVLKEKDNILTESLKIGNVQVIQEILKIEGVVVEKEQASQLFDIALKEKNESFFEFLLADKKYLPDMNENEAWLKLCHAVMNTHDDNFINPFIATMKKHWPGAFYFYVEPKIESWSKLDPLDAQSLLLKFQPLGRDPRQMWDSYFSFFKGNRSNTEVLDLLRSWAKSPPTPEVLLGFPTHSKGATPPWGSYLYSFFGNTKNFEFLLQILFDPDIGVHKTDITFLQRFLSDVNRGSSYSDKMFSELLQHLHQNLDEAQLKNLVSSDVFSSGVLRELSFFIEKDSLSQTQVDSFNKYLMFFSIFPDNQDKTSIQQLSKLLMKWSDVQSVIDVLKQSFNRKAKLNQPINNILEGFIDEALKQGRYDILRSEELASIIINSQPLLNKMVKHCVLHGTWQDVLDIRHQFKEADAHILEAALLANSWELMEEIYLQHYSEKSSLFKNFDKAILQAAIRDKKWNWMGLLYENNQVIEDKAVLEALLIHAVAEGNVNLASKLLEQGVNVNIKNNAGKPLIMYALENENEAMVKLFVNHGADLQNRDKNWYDVYSISLFDDRDIGTRRSKILLKAFGDEHYQSYDKDYKLHLQNAIEDGNFSTLNAFAQLRRLDYTTIFREVVRAGNFKVAEFLLNKYPIIAKDPHFSPYNSLEYAFDTLQNESWINVLLEKNVVVDDDNYQRIIFSAIERGLNKLAIKMINDNYSIKMHPGDARELLMAAIRYGNEEMVEFLLKEKKVDPNFYDFNNVTPLIQAIHKNNDAIIKMLLEYGADVDTPMKQRIRVAEPEPTKILSIEEIDDLLLGGDYGLASPPKPVPTREPTKDKLPPVDDGLEPPPSVQTSSPIGLEDSDAGAPLDLLQSVTFTDERDEPPLEDPAFLKKTNIPNILNTIPDEKDTPLMLAIRGRKLDIAQLLIQSNASLDAVNSAGKTALDLAREFDETESITLLETALKERSSVAAIQEQTSKQDQTSKVPTKDSGKQEEPGPAPVLFGFKKGPQQEADKKVDRDQEQDQDKPRLK